jgi:hypothetical protein
MQELENCRLRIAGGRLLIEDSTFENRQSAIEDRQSH